MTKLIEPGYTKFEITCLNCSAVFQYELDDITEQNDVHCPCCNQRNQHFARNGLLSSKGSAKHED